jgi:hypothetical protein
MHKTSEKSYLLWGAAQPCRIAFSFSRTLSAT